MKGIFFVAVERCIARLLTVLFFVVASISCTTQDTTQTAGGELDLSGYDLQPSCENDFSEPQKLAL